MCIRDRTYVTPSASTGLSSRTVVGSFSRMRYSRWSIRRPVTMVLINFINNALKFTREGSVTLGYRCDEMCIRDRARRVLLLSDYLCKTIGTEESEIGYDRFLQSVGEPFRASLCLLYTS